MNTENYIDLKKLYLLVNSILNYNKNLDSDFR